jgi:hypothetical protein
MADDRLTDLNGKQVHAFANQMANVGFQHMTDLLIAMFKSGSWRSFRDGLGTYEFLPGEFDYFLTQQGVSRADIMEGVRDIETKAQLEAAMDERRTGEDGYRRPILRARAENPKRPGRPIEPFGCTLAEAKRMADADGSERLGRRPPLGMRVRRFRNTGGETSKVPSEVLPLAERIRRSALRLDDKALSDLIEALIKERTLRYESAPRQGGQ